MTHPQRSSVGCRRRTSCVVAWTSRNVATLTASAPTTASHGKASMTGCAPWVSGGRGPRGQGGPGPSPREYLAALYQRLRTLDQVAAHEHVVRGQMERVMKHHGLDRSVDEMRRVYQEQGSVRGFAAYYRVGVRTAYRWLHERGIQLQPSGRPWLVRRAPAVTSTDYIVLVWHGELMDPPDVVVALTPRRRRRMGDQRPR
jgi:hypothetical protein